MKAFFRRLRLAWLDWLIEAAIDEAAHHDGLANANRVAANRLHDRALQLRRRRLVAELSR